MYRNFFPACRVGCAKTLALALLLGLGPAAIAQPVGGGPSPILRWVDAQGKVHFGDALPNTPVQDVKELPHAQPAPLPPFVNPNNPGPFVAPPGLVPTYPQPTPANPPVVSAPATPSGPQSCAQQWQRFNDAYRCLDGHRVAGGGLRNAEQANCPVLRQPDCAQP